MRLSNAAANVQTEIDAAARKGEVATIMLPDKVVLEQPILLRDHIALQGAGGGSVVEVAPGANCHAFTNADWRTSNVGISICDVHVLGNADHQERPASHGPLTYACGFYFNNVRDTMLKRVSVKDIRQTGVHFSRSQRSMIGNFEATALGWSGLSSMLGDNLHAFRVRIHNAGLDVIHSGVHIEGGRGVILTEAVVANCVGNAIMAGSVDGPLEHACFSGDMRSSLRGFAAIGSGHPLRDVFVTGRSIGHDVGVFISNADHIRVQDALVEDSREAAVVLQGRQGGRHCTFDAMTLRGSPLGFHEHGGSRDNFACRVGFEEITNRYRGTPRSSLANSVD
jgi:hypothetical protein